MDTFVPCANEFDPSVPGTTAFMHEQIKRLRRNHNVAGQPSGMLLWSSIDTMAKHALRFLVSSIEYCTAYSPIVRRANQSYLAPGRCLTICRSCMDHASNCGRRPSEGREANCHVRYAGAWERSRTVIVGLCIALVLLACMTVRMPGICPPRQSRAIGL